MTKLNSKKSFKFIDNGSISKSVKQYCLFIKRLQVLFENLRKLYSVSSKSISEKNVILSYSPFTFKILDILKQNEYIQNFERENKKIKVYLSELKSIKELEVSQIDSPVYIDYEQLKNNVKKVGLSVFVTEDGWFTHTELLNKKEGGLFIFQIN